ncbi:MAG: hypothetical protein GPJ22_16620 [Microcystis aeruginosa LL13-03]|jgi:hypothetical protein|nr:hypothetical protein [Microcystis aeruginosa SX13-11]NCR18779.1 hypothetical protein [Microcystis aeruginosa LL13-03]NCR44972.1 hypothetical protein [Microcystis aeruginosa SX13-01]NCR90943.1 hypothetical protein [Microcystis aeruginosa G13-10]NCS17239.1 hypothetical protein [Microcystis aeruginosa G13-12]NCS36164.1 hypothetical protein [Microcystis aeruginosa G11-01]NCT52534.1 hypothetical protein [Microcystis aeruginosa G13-03]NCT65664.1 hypothetical protein [Microcystis aeruginosa G13-
MPEEKAPQSISISNSHISELQLGQSGGNLSQIQEVQQSLSEKQIASEDVVGLLAEIEMLMKASALPEAQKAKAISYVEAAKTEAKEEKPDKSYAANSLHRATKVIKEASEAVEAGQGLGKKVQDIVVRLLPWLGVAKDFFGF